VFAPEDLFDLTGFVHARLFAGLSAAWDAVGRLPEYVAEAFGMTWAEIEAREDRGRGLVRVAAGATVEEGALVRGPVVIERGCHVYTGSLVRGPAILGEDALVGHSSEISASVLLNGVHAAHLNYVGNSVVGRDANLGAGTVCSNFKLSQGTVRVRVGEATHETGLPKLGALLGDGVQTGCHVIMNPGTIVGPRTLVYAGAQLRGYYPGDHIIKVEQTLTIARKR